MEPIQQTLPDYFERTAHQLNFFGVLSLLEEHFAEKGVADPIAAGRILFRADVSFAFPSSDIVAFRAIEESYLLVLSFMGLTGVSSPLPVYFSDSLARHEAAARPLYDFLTIFNERLYGLFYKAWKKYHLLRSMSHVEHDPLVRCIAALAGKSLNEKSTEDDIRMLAYAGSFSGAARGKGGLEALLSDFFGGVKVKIREFMPSWIPLAHPTKLGDKRTGQLGVSAISGTFFYDRSSKFRVCIGPLNRIEFERFLPNGDYHLPTKRIIEAYLAELLDYDIEVLLQSVALVPLQLGSDKVRLGETATLGGSQGVSEVKSMVVEGRSFANSPIG